MIKTQQGTDFRKLPMALIVFDANIREEQLRLFRGAIIKLGGNEALLHNHSGEGYNYSYPKIQYKLLDNHPAVLGIEEGASLIKEDFFEKSVIRLRLGHSMREMPILSCEECLSPVGLTEESHLYAIENWLPLNETNFREYQQANGMIERIVMLQKILTGNILSFAKGVNLFFDRHVECQIEEINAAKKIIYKNVGLKSFSLTFTSNILLPQLIGLGKSVSLNHGNIIKL